MRSAMAVVTDAKNPEAPSFILCPGDTDANTRRQRVRCGIRYIFGVPILLRGERHT